MPEVFYRTADKAGKRILKTLFVGSYEECLEFFNSCVRGETIGRGETVRPIRTYSCGSIDAVWEHSRICLKNWE